MIIYLAMNIKNGKPYVGQTIREFEVRKAQHKYDSERLDLTFYKAIRKHGWEAFEWSIIDTAETIEELNEKEKFWIDFYHAFYDKNKIFFGTTQFGYNSTSGGGNYEFSEEVKEKLVISAEERLLNDKYHTSKIKVEDVIEIKKALINSSMKQIELAKKYGVSYTAIHYIDTNKNWTCVQTEGWNEYQQFKNEGWYNINLSLRQNKKMLQAFKDGLGPTKAAEIVGVKHGQAKHCFRKYRLENIGKE